MPRTEHTSGLAYRRWIVGVAGLCLLGVGATLWHRLGGTRGASTAEFRSEDAAAGEDLSNATGLSPEAIARLLTMSPVPAAPPDPSNGVADDPIAAHFGRFLFFDERLSGDFASMSGDEGSVHFTPVSCSHCHQPERAFTDGSPIAQGIGMGDRHTPALFNTAHNRWFNWDGRRDSHWAQAIEAIERPHEMGSNRLAIAHLIHRDADLRAAYQRIFGDPPVLSGDAVRDARPAHDDDPADADHPHVRAWAMLSDEDRHAANTIISNLAKAIAAYQRRLVSHEARFDAFVRGLRTHDASLIAMLDDEERRGAELFASTANCWQCHHGPLLTDHEFHNIKVPLPGGPSAMPRDAGRFAGIPVVRNDPFNAQGVYADDPLADASRRLEYLKASPELWGAFKTPSLRDVALTAPYFHNGGRPDLASVLDHYNTFAEAPRVGHGHLDPLLQPLNFPEEDLRAIEAFLATLTGRALAEELLEPPGTPLPDGERAGGLD